MTPIELAGKVRSRLPDTVVSRGEVTAVVERDGLVDALEFLSGELGLSFLCSVTATDHPGRRPRFWIVYELRTIGGSVERVRIKVGLSEDDPHVPSVTSIFPTADWHERETFDFYGVIFDGHPGLVRILLPDDWDGYPLRKDEELGGVNTRYHGAFIPPIDTRTMA